MPVELAIPPGKETEGASPGPWIPAIKEPYNSFARAAGSYGDFGIGRSPLRGRMTSGLRPGRSTYLNLSGVAGCRPHSRFSGFSHHQRPERTSSPTEIARVQGAQPMLG